MLDHERLDVYQCAVAFFELAKTLGAQVPRGYAELAEQLRRASSSIPLNIAEGAGKPSLADRRHAHAVARGSAMECGAILDTLAILAISEDDCRKGKELLIRIVSMLSKMCR